MIKCIICKNQTSKIFSQKKFNYYKCKDCKIVSTIPYPTKKQILNHYNKEFISGNYKFLREYESDYNKIYSGFAKEIIKYYKNNGESIKNKSLLDIGCFTGEFLKIMKKEGCNVNGIELQKKAAAIANIKLKSKSVKSSDVSTDPFKNKKFDIITMFGLIEHVEDPNLLIRSANKMLKRDGILVIQTPNSQSLISLSLGKYWPPYTPVEHIHLFSKNSINKLLIKYNLHIIRFKNHVKILPIGYVYKMLMIFSPEIKRLLDNIPIIKFEKIKYPMPFYVGEMFIIAKRYI